MRSSSDLLPYETYQSSGSRWIGDVPTHWEVGPIGRLGRFFKGTGGTKEDEVSEGVPCVRYGDLYTRHQFFIIGSRSFVTPERAADYTSIRFGDVLFAGSGETLEEIGKSAVNLIDGQACCGGDVLIFRPAHPVDPRFLGYAADYSASVHQKACMGRGVTVMHIYADDLKYLRVALPPADEQAGIVRYLAAFDQNIAQLIGTKRRLITLLNEQKQQVVQAAVIRGLDASIRRRDSGVPWLGDVPLDWEIRRAKWYYREVDERSLSGEEELLSVSHITGVTRRSEKNITMFKAESYVGHKLCREDDVVINTMWAWMGALGTAHETGLVSPAYAVYRAIRGDAFNPQFIDYLLRTPTYVGEYVRRSTGIRSSRLRLYPPQFLDIPLVRPSLEQQVAIVDQIAGATKELDHGVRVAEGEIALLLEYRSRMIFDVVSGKVDVRDAAGSLPEPEVADRLPLEIHAGVRGDLDDGADLLDEVSA